VNGVSGTASAVAAGYYHSCAIRSGTGAVVCWGSNFDGEATPPASVNGTSGTANAVAAGGTSFYGHSCAIRSGTRAVVCWGANFFGESSPPNAVNGTSGTASAIAASGTHSCAIQTGTGAVVCWGSNGAGEATPPPSVNGTSGTASAIAAGGPDGSGHSCAIQSGTGAVVCWGDNSYGQASPPASVNGISGTASAIAAGGTAGFLGAYAHSCAIQAGTGAVVCWGNDGFGQSTPPSTLDGVNGRATAIAAGGSHSLAIVSLDPDCSNGFDDDGDGLVDHPADAGCSAATDDSERTFVGTIPAGQNVSLTLLGGTGTPGGVEVLFSDTGAGTLTGEVYTISQADLLSNPPPDLPTINFQLPSDPVMYWQLDFTGQLNGTVTLTFTYDETTLTVPESQLKVRHYENGVWVELAGAVDTVANTITVTVTSFSPFALAVDSPACDDGTDNDGDGLADYPADPGCQSAAGTLENPKCQDGGDNDFDGFVDFDGGESIHGACSGGACPSGVSDPNQNGIADPDPQCVGKPWRNKESPGSCGLDFELALIVPALAALRRWRRRAGVAN
jgi:hypothetical protein